jgi:hypothetical protein
MTKAVTHSLISIAIFGVMQTSSVAQDCYFNNITFQPPNPALCYLQQSVPSPQSHRQAGCTAACDKPPETKGVS